MIKNKDKSSSISKWQLSLVALLLFAIFLYFLIGLTTLRPIYNTAAKDIPLLIVIILCGVPLILQAC